MKRARIYCHDKLAAYFSQLDATNYRLDYEAAYEGPSISLTLPRRAEPYFFSGFPAFFDGLLPEGLQLEALLKIAKLGREDYFQQLITVGQDLVGAVTVEAADD